MDKYRLIPTHLLVSLVLIADVRKCHAMNCGKALELHEGIVNTWIVAKPKSFTMRSVG